MSVQARTLLSCTTMRRRVAGFAPVIAGVLPAVGYTQTSPKLDRPPAYRATLLTGRSAVIVQPLSPDVDLLLQSVGATLGRALPITNARVAALPNVTLPTLAGSAVVRRLALDRRTLGATSDSETVVWDTTCVHDCDPVIWNR